MYTQAPVAGTQVSIVQNWPSSQLTGVPAWHVPPTHVSTPLHRFPSEQSGSVPHPATTRFTHHPWRVPESPLVSSTTYRLHVPFGFVALKTDSAEPPAGVGAGAAKVSPVVTLVGLKVPEARGPASGERPPRRPSA